jgi:hypothetical protein
LEHSELALALLSRAATAHDELRELAPRVITHVCLALGEVACEASKASARDGAAGVSRAAEEYDELAAQFVSGWRIVCLELTLAEPRAPEAANY